MSPAARQFAVLLWLASALLVAFAWHAGTPMDAAALKPRIEQAYSFASEAALLARQAQERRLPAPVLARQAGQLLRHVRRATTALARARAAPEPDAVRRAARDPLLVVERALEQLAVGEGADRDGLARAADQLQAQVQALQRLSR